jgi:hypothetical protein
VTFLRMLDANFRFPYIPLVIGSRRMFFEKELRQHTVVAGDGRSKIMLRAKFRTLLSERVRSYQRLSRACQTIQLQLVRKSLQNDEDVLIEVICTNSVSQRTD